MAEMVEMAALAANNNHENHGLHMAARNGCISDLRKYITKENVDVLNNDEETALHLAAEFEHAECVTVLLAYGAKQTVDSRGYTPLHSAAMSFSPNASIARLLVEAAIQRGDNFQQLLNKQSNRKYGENTALHVAAGNLNVTAEFIKDLKDINPRIQNSVGDTAFHVAAKSSNPQIIIYLLSTFRPIRAGWAIDDVDENRSKQAATLLSMCTRSGNAKAVALLIQHGADVSKGVLHQIVVASVKKPEMVDKFLAVYQAVVDNAVTWRCLKYNLKCLIRGSTEYNEILRETVIYLTTKPFTDGKNMIQRAIELGASEMLFAIVNTDNVYKFDDFGAQRNVVYQVKCSNTRYDVTDFTRLSTGPLPTLDKSPLLAEYHVMEQSFRNPHHPSIPYLEELLLHEEQWENNNIFEMPPFRELTEPYCRLVFFYYFIISFIHFLFMKTFTDLCFPDTCTLASMFGSATSRGNISLLSCTPSVSAAAQQRAYPSWLWLIWPAIVFGCSTISFFIRSYWHTGKHLLRDIGKIFALSINDPRIIIASLMAAVNSLPKIAFCVSLFIWFHRYAHCDDRQLYLEALSMVLLFGWIVLYEFSVGLRSRLHVFFLVLKEVIVHDILLCFLLVFLYTFEGFSISLCVLGKNVETRKNISCLDMTSYLLISVLRIDSLFEEPKIELNEHTVLFRVVFAFYVCFTVVILLTVLIAMINNRYEDAKRRAESVLKLKVLKTAFILLKFSRYLPITKYSPMVNFKFIDMFLDIYKDKKNPRRVFVKVSQSEDGVKDRQKKLLLL